MATVANFLAKPIATVISRPSSTVASTSSFVFFDHKPNSLTRRKNTPRRLLFSTVKVKAGAASPGKVGSPAAKDEKLVKIHSGDEFDEALKNAKSKLVVVEFATSKSDQSNKIYPFMVELSKTCNDVVFLLVMGDESDKTRELCRREKIEKVPHFSFYKSMEKIHEEEGYFEFSLSLRKIKSNNYGEISPIRKFCLELDFIQSIIPMILDQSLELRKIITQSIKFYLDFSRLLTLFYIN